MMAIMTKTMMQPITLYRLMVVRLEFHPRPDTSSGSSESASSKNPRKFQISFTATRWPAICRVNTQNSFEFEIRRVDSDAADLSAGDGAAQCRPDDIFRIDFEVGRFLEFFRRFLVQYDEHVGNQTAIFPDGIYREKQREGLASIF